jgi:hypothetical protein
MKDKTLHLQIASIGAVIAVLLALLSIALL